MNLLSSLIRRPAPGSIVHRAGYGAAHSAARLVECAVACIVSFALLLPSRLDAQVGTDSVNVRVTVRRDSAAVPGARVQAAESPASSARRTDEAGRATLTLPRGTWTLVTTRLGFRPDTLRLTLGAAADTSIEIALEAVETELDEFVVTATRAERRIEDTPLRVEAIDEEEIAEKVAMTPGDITMMLNETSGLRVQTTNPSLGGANVRIQGLRGRYSLILADGLPLYGGQSGGLGLLQIPPVDLGRVEVIKGTASALYGSNALGGVINLMSRRPGAERERTLLLNQTSRGGTDAVWFSAAPLGELEEGTAGPRWGYSTLLGAHRQARGDIDGDRWTDLPGYRRLVARPRLYFDDHEGRTAFITGGLTVEERRGGTLSGGTVPDSTGPIAFDERLGTQRADLGALVRWVLDRDARLLDGAIVTVRGSAVQQSHSQRLGAEREDDQHRTWFAEASVTIPREAMSVVLGAAMQQERYENETVPEFDHAFSVPAAFAQLDVDAARWLTLSASARADAHSEFGTFVSPRVSALLRAPREDGASPWTLRLSHGAGISAPSPLTEETEATGLSWLRMLGSEWTYGLRMERATSSSVDLGMPIAIGVATLEVNVTGFASRIAHPLVVRQTGTLSGTGPSPLMLASAPEPTRTSGGELLLRLTRPIGELNDEGEPEAVVRVSASYANMTSTECDPDMPFNWPGVACFRRDVPLTPRQTAGMVIAFEAEDKGRIGIELYHTGRQALADDPYRTDSEPYLIAGFLVERIVPTRLGSARFFVNLENLTNVRQTRHDPLLRPERGPGGRWSTDAWTDLQGFTVNGGVKLSF